ncbi:MAG: phosphoenolpyruvate synthase [Clostridium sp.]|jgi:pyruvate,water dikinase|uniref:phosphoenolpyruvate synthase n=2 Tax=Clostridium sp. TaxID=1506 RepID=UPI0025B81D60|nr:phosphoenolpyruvate synthase [Clostridium sp.]MCH3963590.1 phosphoenolpyruvate synthase [Clostridium sp.]MCI1714731.1 phosphoenolpyruvate synthase [Clostridium sp.]MCI1799080.1 phosphoenolpyruvate synthase [Clostridium sp.]MCI1812914.1 phosphoenolpyruvate synthase [Clostridium sp.]MCI1869804.1 phosphoenolpyruvate synthase [Clostridium sp.]
MNSYVLGFQEIDKTRPALVGGKGANLGKLSRIDGIRVPEGFCVTTEAYREIIGNNREFNLLLDQLSILKADNVEGIGKISAKIRKVIEAIAIPDAIDNEITRHLVRLGEKNAYAVRSSATAEDLPTASFAGQQDTYLNIIGKEAILRYISKCWASLFTERAVIYRIQNGFDHRKVYLSVVIQKMVFPEAAGIMFTADPITMNRKVISIDASFGLGEALVSGLVNADNYKVRDGEIINKKISTKKLAIHGLKEGGTEEKKINAECQNKQTLTDEQILELEKTGRRIETYFGGPQDIEWCLYENKFFIVQSRPITTLYPIPDVQDGKNHVYMSMGHQQMMTDVMKPLGLSFFQLEFKEKSEDNQNENTFIEAGGRLFIDISYDINSPLRRKIVLTAMKKIDPLILDAIKNLMKRKNFMRSLARGGKRYFNMGSGYFSWELLRYIIKISRSNDASVVKTLMLQNEASIRKLQKRIENLSGDKLFSSIEEEQKQLKKAMYDSESMAAVYAGVLALNWINKNMEKWLGEKNAADSLSKSAPNNVTSEMGLELLDVADVVRQYPEVLEYLEHASDETFFEDLSKLEGGSAVSKSIGAYLEKYGMRCPGEIDITRPRFSEKPTALVPMILNNIKNFDPGAHKVLFEQGMLEAKRREQDLLKRLEQLPGGKQKAKKTRKKISLLRNFIGYREYPKYLMICHYWVIKQALMKEAVRLVQKEVIRQKEDIYYLTFEELRQVVHTDQLDYSIIRSRKEECKTYEKLTPSRIMTSEGEALSGEYDTGSIPEGALAGIPASSGTIEGRARVVLRMEDAALEEGDILVTAFTDPSWTPVFVSIKGLVTEVGGMMTHGSVIAREYGLPAVVGVENATRLIKDGQKIRVNGTEGYIEIL